MNELLDTILTKLDRTGVPDGKFPDRKGEYWALCPFHADTNPTSFSASERGYCCLACGAKGGLKTLAGKLGLELPKDPPPSCTLADYAAAKHLPTSFLCDLGLTDHVSNGRMELHIPYMDQDKRVLRVKRRLALGKTAGMRFTWAKSQNRTMYLYGLWKLAEFRLGGWVLLVEGESDAQTGWLHGLPVLGVPGANTWSSSWAPLLEGMRVYVWLEADQGGKAFVTRISQDIKGLMVLRSPDSMVKDLSDAHIAGMDVRDMVMKLKHEAKPLAFPDSGSMLPVVIINDREPRELIDEMGGVLRNANQPPTVFVRSGALVRTRTDEQGRTMLEQLTTEALRGIFTRIADFRNVSTTKDVERRAPTWPPDMVIRDILTCGGWDLPALLTFVETPIIHLDGGVVATPGYDAETMCFYVPAPGLVVPQIADQVDNQSVAAAAALVVEPLCDFPYEDQAARANAVAALITPVLRTLIKGPIPMVLIDKPQAGTGATLQAEVVARIATGRPAAVLTAPRTEEEWRKLITSQVMNGTTMVTLDNLDGTLFSPSLAAALTSAVWQDRILGRSEIMTMPNLITWTGTGNNIRLGGDLPRRCYWVRMNSKQAQPWQRSGFRHPQLVNWVLDHRGALLAAIFTLARGWIQSGRPVPTDLPRLGSYDAWVNVIGGILAYAGIEGFLGNLQAMYEMADDDTPAWETFLTAWHETWGDAPMTAAEVTKELGNHQALRDALPGDLAETLQDPRRSFSRCLGKALSAKAEVRYPCGLYLHKGGLNTSDKAVRWHVRRTEPDVSDGLSGLAGLSGPVIVTGKTGTAFAAAAQRAEGNPSNPVTRHREAMTITDDGPGTAHRPAVALMTEDDLSESERYYLNMADDELVV